jgi:hypothetical protein
MPSRRPRPFECNLVHEIVEITLREKPTGDPRAARALFVQCDQAECQYASRNESPCPLTLTLFAEEIEARAERARRRRDEAG